MHRLPLPSWGTVGGRWLRRGESRVSQDAVATAAARNARGRTARYPQGRTFRAGWAQRQRTARAAGTASDRDALPGPRSAQGAAARVLRPLGPHPTFGVLLKQTRHVFPRQLEPQELLRWLAGPKGSSEKVRPWVPGDSSKLPLVAALVHDKHSTCREN